MAFQMWGRGGDLEELWEKIAMPGMKGIRDQKEVWIQVDWEVFLSCRNPHRGLDKELRGEPNTGLTRGIITGCHIPLPSLPKLPE